MSKQVEEFIGSLLLLVLYFAGAVLVFNCVLLLINLVNL